MKPPLTLAELEQWHAMARATDAALLASRKRQRLTVRETRTAQDEARVLRGWLRTRSLTKRQLLRLNFLQWQLEWYGCTPKERL